MITLGCNGLQSLSSNQQSNVAGGVSLTPAVKIDAETSFRQVTIRGSVPVAGPWAGSQDVFLPLSMTCGKFRTLCLRAPICRPDSGPDLCRALQGLWGQRAMMLQRFLGVSGAEAGSCAELGVLIGLALDARLTAGPALPCNSVSSWCSLALCSWFGVWPRLSRCHCQALRGLPVQWVRRELGTRAGPSLLNSAGALAGSLELVTLGPALTRAVPQPPLGRSLELRCCASGPALRPAPGPTAVRM